MEGPQDAPLEKSDYLSGRTDTGHCYLNIQELSWRYFGLFDQKTWRSVGVDVVVVVVQLDEIRFNCKGFYFLGDN